MVRDQLTQTCNDHRVVIYQNCESLVGLAPCDMPAWAGRQRAGFCSSRSKWRFAHLCVRYCKNACQL